MNVTRAFKQNGFNKRATANQPTFRIGTNQNHFNPYMKWYRLHTNRGRFSNKLLFSTNAWKDNTIKR